jgi:hypothetical protein
VTGRGSQSINGTAQQSATSIHGDVAANGDCADASIVVSAKGKFQRTLVDNRCAGVAVGSRECDCAGALVMPLAPANWELIVVPMEAAAVMVFDAALAPGGLPPGSDLSQRDPPHGDSPWLDRERRTFSAQSDRADPGTERSGPAY